MAKQSNTDSITQFNSLKSEILSGKFRPFYIFCGEEPYYGDVLSSLIIDNSLRPEEKDFNFTLLYGNDTNVPEIMSLCSRYPMMAERQVIVIKEAQNLKKIEDFAIYLDNIVETTVLVICMSGKSIDKRTSFYKKTQSQAVLFDSQAISQDNIPNWANQYAVSLGKNIETEAALLLAEAAGTELRKLSLEIDKLIKAIPIDATTITATDVENNVGISRTFNITEMTNALASRNRQKTFDIAFHLYGTSNKNILIKDLGFIFYFFAKVEELHAAKLSNNMSTYEAAKSIRLFGSFGKPFMDAANTYPLKKVMAIISHIKECDYKCKSNSRGNASDGELLIELLGKILN